MKYWEILVFCIGISLDVFGAAVCQGAVLGKLRRGQIVAVCLITCAFQLAAMEIGRLLGTLPRFMTYYSVAAGVWRLLAALIFLALGAYLLIKAVRKKAVFEHLSEIHYKNVAVTAILTSIDSLLAGISSRFLDAYWLSCLTTLLGVTAICTLGGIATGYHFGYSQKNVAYGIGGVLFLFTAADVLIRSLL